MQLAIFGRRERGLRFDSQPSQTCNAVSNLYVLKTKKDFLSWGKKNMHQGQVQVFSRLVGAALL